MAEEERFTRVKHAIRTYPVNAARFCLEHAGIEPRDLDVIAIGWDLPRLYPRFGGQWDFNSPREFISNRLGWSFPHDRDPSSSAFRITGLMRRLRSTRPGPLGGDRHQRWQWRGRVDLYLRG